MDYIKIKNRILYLLNNEKCSKYYSFIPQVTFYNGVFVEIIIVYLNKISYSRLRKNEECDLEINIEIDKSEFTESELKEIDYLVDKQGSDLVNTLLND